MPCLKNGDFKIVESMEIAKYVDSNFACGDRPNLTDCKVDEEVNNMVSAFFPSFAKFMKNTEFSQDRENALMSSLAKLNKHFEANDFLNGSNVTLLDYSLAPKLLHMYVTTRKFYPSTSEKISKEFPHLKRYFFDTMMKDEAFASTQPPDDIIIWGWTQARKGTE